MSRTILTLFCGLLLCMAGVLATEFQPIGFESIGMGGAGVASARGSMAGYYNPALLAASPNLLDIVPGGGIGVRENNLSENIDRLVNANLGTLFTDLATAAPGGAAPADVNQRAKDVQASIQSLSGGNNSLGFMPSATVGIQVRNIAIGVFATSDAGGQAIIDSAHTDFIIKRTVGGVDVYAKYDPAANSYVVSDAASYNASSLEYALDPNDEGHRLTYLKLDGMATIEVPISYARRIPVPVGTLALGASVKPIQGITYRRNVQINTESGTIEDQLTNNDKKSSAVGVDLGLLYIPPVARNVRFGLVGKNLNKPKFETVTGPDMELASMWRAGMSMDLTSLLTLAADVDLTKNERFDGTESQYIGGGINFHPLGILSVRVGAMKNLSTDNDGVILTAGLGMGFKMLQFDLAAQAATKSSMYDGNSLPRYARVNLALVSRW